MKICKPNDVITVMKSGTLTLQYGQGRKADKIEVGAGEVIEVTEHCKVEGTEIVHWPAPIPRTVAKRAAAPQKLRKCGDTLTRLEIPDTADPLVRDIEAKLEQRGALLRHAIQQAAERLKTGKGLDEQPT